MLKHLALIALIMFAGLLADSASARACDPGSSHSTNLIADDTPECLSLVGSGYGEGSVYISNRCEEEVLLSVVECGQCDSQLVVGPKESAHLTVEARGRAEFGRKATTSQTYTWEIGELEGTFETEVNYRDNSGDCSFVPGCAQPGMTGLPSGGAAVVLLLLMVFGLRRLLQTPAPQT